MKPSLLAVIIFFCGIQLTNAQNSYPKKVIQFGWDYPTISFILKNQAKMEERPFDGVAFSFDFRIYDLFDTTLYPEKIFQFDDLKKFHWNKFTDNFIRVRAESLNGPQWLNDQGWENIVHNVRNISKAISISGSKGIFFDPEYYYHHLPQKNTWIYDSTLYPGMTYDEVGSYVEKRGKQFIRALEYYKQDPKLLSFWMLSLVTLQARTKLLTQTGMALFPFFVQGMMSGKNKYTTIIDGNELGFSYRNPYQFILSGEEIIDWGTRFMPDSLKAVYRQTTVAQPIFYDLILGTFSQYNKGLTHAQKTAWLSENLYNAFKVSDKYVWFYNQKFDWWRGNLNNKIAKIIQEVKNKLAGEYANRDQPTAGQSYDVINGKLTKNDFFSFTYDPQLRKLEVTFQEDDIQRFKVFESSKNLFEIENPAKQLSLTIPTYSGLGNLILIAINKKNQYSFFFIN